MKPLRVLSPIEPGELCWVRVDGEWWLVRAHVRATDCCSDCELMGNGWDICETVPCGDMGFSRVHPIPMPAHGMRDVTGLFFDADGVWDVANGTFTRIGPPEE